ncbi:MAG: YbaB/EbfC family nucleoid-associated protein [Anaerolineae bacterium]|nr:YbaB/EbfC family nucleoid-associated protein [Anaerolineae bacterium]
MAKRRRPAGGGGMPGGGNMNNMMAQIQQMQKDMEEAQAALEHETVEVSVGGGAITIVITGHQRVQSISINPDVIDTDDEEWVADLQDLLLAATNQAIEQSQTMAAEKMEKITGGLGSMPGLGGLLG